MGRQQWRSASTGFLPRNPRNAIWGALDLALCLQKKDKTAFAAVIPALQALKNPTGKEQVILDELLGEGNGAQDILNLPGYGLYDVEKEWIIPEIAVDESDAEKLLRMVRMCVSVS